MVPTPLQTMLGLDALHRDLRDAGRKRAGAVRPAGRFRRAPAQARGDRDDIPAAVGQRADRRRFALHPQRAGRSEGRGGGLRALPVRRDPAGARVRRRDDAARQGPLLDYRQGPADAGVVVRGGDGGAVHRLRRAAAFDPDDDDRVRGGAGLRAAGDSRQYFQRPVALDGAARSIRATGSAAGITSGRSRESRGGRRRS